MLLPPLTPQSQFPRLIPRSHAEREQNYQSHHRIYLSVQVTAPSGQPIESLQPSDFTLLQDHQPRPFTSLRLMDSGSQVPPARVTLVLDALNNSAGKVTSYRKQIAKYLQSGTAPLANPTSIALLSERGIQLASASTDRAAVLRQLDQLAGNLQSLSCRDTTLALQETNPGEARDPNPQLGCFDHLFNGSIIALNTLAESLINQRKKPNQPQRNLVLWFGRGWPLLNQRGYIPDTHDIKADFYSNLVTVSGALTEAQVTLHALASSEVLPVSRKKLPDSYFFQGASSPKDTTAANLSLQAFAFQSGGTVSESNKDLAAQIARCVPEVQSYYLLQFDYPPAHDTGEYHSLEIKLNPPGPAVRTRTLYYAEP